jgi:hypothetical protein
MRISIAVYLTICLTFSSAVTHSQTRTDQRIINDAVDKYRQAPNDSLKRLALHDLDSLCNIPQLRGFVIVQLNNISDPEIDQLIGDHIIPIDSIKDFISESLLLEKMNLANRPYSFFIIEQQIINSKDAIHEESLKEMYRKQLFIKMINSFPMRGISAFLKYYFRNPANLSSLNDYWKKSNLNIVTNQILENPKYDAAYVNIFFREVKEENVSANSNSQKISETFTLLHSRMYNNKLCRKCKVDSIPTIFRSESYLLTLTPEQLSGAIGSYLSSIKSGSIILTEDVMQIFKKDLNATSNLQIDELVHNYNNLLQVLLLIINKNYFSEDQLKPAAITKEALLANSNAPIISQGLSIPYLLKYLVEQITSKTSNATFAEIIVDEAMAEQSLLAYGRKVDNKALISNVGVISNLNNSSPVDYIKYVTRKSFKKIVVTNRTYDLTSYRVTENSKIKRKFWFTKKVVYTTDIPLKMRNIILSNRTVLDASGYSFFERDLSVNFGKNKPFQEVVDIISNEPKTCFGILKNSVSNQSYPLKFVFTEIGEKVASGEPTELYSYIGLKLGYQKPMTPKGIFTGMHSTINNSLISEDDKKSFNAAFLQTPSMVWGRNYLNYLDSQLVFDQRTQIDRLHANTITYHAHIIVNNLIYRRANDLPEKDDCGWWQALWCNGDRNRQLNEQRQYHINNSAYQIQTNNKKLSSISEFDILKLHNAKQIEPFYTAYDTISRSILCLVRITSENGFNILPVSTRLNEKNNIDKADKFWKKYDSAYLERYNIDLSNLSDHDFQYFAELSNNFIKENMSSNTIGDRLNQGGYTKINYFFPENKIDGYENNEFVNNINLQSYYLVSERKLIRKIKNEYLIPKDITIEKGNELSATTNSQLNSALQGTLAQVNQSFDSALETWNEWFIFIGFSSFNGYTIPWVQFGGGSLRISIALPMMGPIPIIPLPRNFSYTPF